MYKLDQNKLDAKLASKQDFSGKKVLLRTCLNVITDKAGNIVDDTRLIESLPTIVQLANNSRQLIIVAHLGRPKERSAETSFAKLVDALSTKLNKDIFFANDLDNLTLERIKTGFDKIVMIENIRYFDGEDAKEEYDRKDLLEKLTSLADVFVNDAFADYRKSVSSYYIAQNLPSFVGDLFAREMIKLTAVNSPNRPFVAIIGGSKLSEKIDTVESLLQIADKVFVAGGIATTIMKANGQEIGTSLCETEKLDVAKSLYQKYSDKLLLPIDFQINKDFANPTENIYVDAENIPADHMVLDMGPKTIQMLKDTIASAKTIVANGTVGVYEFTNCQNGSRAVLEAIADNDSAYTLIGGGNTIEAANQFGISRDKFDHVSTGGGAMLAVMAYDVFPTLDVILN